MLIDELSDDDVAKLCLKNRLYVLRKDDMESIVSMLNNKMVKKECDGR